LREDVRTGKKKLLSKTKTKKRGKERVDGEQ